MVGNYRVLTSAKYLQKADHLNPSIRGNRQGTLAPFSFKENSHWNTAKLSSLGCMNYQQSLAMVQRGKSLPKVAIPNTGNPHPPWQSYQWQLPRKLRVVFLPFSNSLSTFQVYSDHTS